MNGEWWLPERHDLRCRGLAQLSNTSFSSLHVQGNLSTPQATEGQLARYLPLGDGSQIIGRTDQVIWGICQANDIHEFEQSHNCVSLFNAQLRYDLPDSQTWLFRGLAEGSAHVTEETIVDSLEIQFDVFADQYKVQYLKALSSQSEREIHIQTPDNSRILVSLERAEIELHVAPTLASNRVCYSHEARVRLTDPLKIGKVLDKWILPIYSLVGFLTLTPVRITNMTARLFDSNETVRLDYRGLGDDQRADTSTHSSDFPVKVGTLEGSLDSLVRRWLTLYDDHASFVTLLLRSFDASIVVVDFRLLLAALAIEQLHAQHFDQRQENSIDFKRKRNAAVAACQDASEELADWVSNKLNYNQKSLRLKIEEISDISGGTGMKIMEAWPNFVRDAVEARNQIAHAKRSVGDIWQVMTAATGLRWIAYHAYLVKLGLSEDTVTSCVTRCHQFEKDIQLIREYCRKRVT